MPASRYVNGLIRDKVSLVFFIGWLAVSLVDLGGVWLCVVMWSAKLALSIGIEVWQFGTLNKVERFGRALLSLCFD